MTQGSCDQMHSSSRAFEKGHQPAANSPLLSPQSIESTICNFCGLHFPNRVLLQRHLETDHRDSLMKCSLCGKGYRSYQGLQYHMERHKGTSFPCPVCDARLSSKSKVKRHLLQVHNCIPCATCAQIFPSGPLYTQHVLNCV